LGTNPPINRQYLSIAIVNDKLYFIGGFTDHLNNIPGYFGDYATNEEYTPFGYGAVESQPFPTVPIVALVAVAVAVGGGIIYLKKTYHR
jgi:hypothetical protein